MKIYIKSGAEDIFPESNPKTSPDMLRKFAKSNRLSDRRMVAYNPSTPSDTLDYLMDIDDDIVKSGIYHNPNATAKAKEKLYQYFKGKGSDTMKAYHIQPAFANRQIRCSSFVKTELDDYVGTDLWVKVRGYQWTSDYYINIIRKLRNHFGELCYEFRNVDAMHIDNADNDFAIYHNPEIIEELWVTPVSCVEVFKPVEVVTTDEVYQILGVE